MAGETSPDMVRQRGIPIKRQALLALVVLALGAAAAGGLILAKQTPSRQHKPSPAPLVETVLAERRDVPVTVEGQGTVEATVRTQLVSQVGGRVVQVHEELVKGGLIEAGETVLQIDRSDYQIALEEAQSRLEQARSNKASAAARIEEAEARLEDADEDLQRTRRLRREGVANQREVDKAEIARRIAAAQLESARSELQTAQARVSSAETAVRKAELNLERTTLTLPFDAVVLDERVDAGQYINAGQSVGEVYGTKAAEVPVPLEDRHLEWFDALPTGRSRSAGAGAEQRAQVEVTTTFAGRRCRWAGRVVRTEGEVDRRSRMVRVVVRVDDPLGLKVADKPPLMPGTFVEVTIHGRTMKDVVPLPRHAIRRGDRVWVVEDGRVRIREARIVRRESEQVFLRSGVEAGERVITSPMDTVTDGMRVRVEAGADRSENATAPTDRENEKAAEHESRK